MKKTLILAVAGVMSALMAFGAVGLPEGYKAVACIESTKGGKQCIDTEYTANANTKVVMDAYIPPAAEQSDTACVLFGSRTLGDWAVKAFSVQLLGVEYIRFAYNGQYVDSPTKHSFGERMTITCDKNQLTWTGSQPGSAQVTVSPLERSKSTLYIFGDNTVSDDNGKCYGPFNPSVMRLYSFRIYEGEELVRNFVPCVNTATGEAGLYDNRAGGKFYGNKGSGAFRAKTQVVVTSVTAQQRHPWDRLVDISVTVNGSKDDLDVANWSFVAMDCATKAVIPVSLSHITQIGDDTGSGEVWTRKFIWDAATDVGDARIEDVELTVTVDTLPYVQLWEDGPCFATCNIGAMKPEECGHYFWWGDTIGYKRNANDDGWISVKDSSPFIFGEDNYYYPLILMKFRQLIDEKYIDGRGCLMPQYDAAVAHLGEQWRIPMLGHWRWAAKNCTVMWAARNGVEGVWLVGKGAYASKSIFLPETGTAFRSNLCQIGLGCYWTSEPSTIETDAYACSTTLEFYAGTINCNEEGDLRSEGCPIRAYRLTPDGDAASATSTMATHLALDCRTSARRISDEGMDLHYDASWYANGRQIQITDNGKIIETGVSGVKHWTPTYYGNHHLQLTAVDDSGAQVGVENADIVCISPSGAVVVPDDWTEIPAGVFTDCDWITSVTIPASVTRIAENAFSGCKGVKEYIVDPENQNYKAVYGSLVTKDGMTVIASVNKGKVVLTSVTARQRYPWNGKVDIEVAGYGDEENFDTVNWSFVAMDCATKAVIPVSLSSITQVGDDVRSGEVWTRKFIWDAATDVGDARIEDVELTVTVDTLPYVQLWEDGPCFATCNIGATKPEECGYYFWWSDTVGYKRNANDDGWISVKDSSPFLFVEENYDYPINWMKFRQLIDEKKYVDGRACLVPQYDAAAAHLGEQWRMPTLGHWEWAVKNCTVMWVARNGVEGVWLVGKGAYASKSIFLPETGSAFRSDLCQIGLGCYWTSEPSTTEIDGYVFSKTLEFHWGIFNSNEVGELRYEGYPIRAYRLTPDDDAANATSKLATHLTLDCQTSVRRISDEGVGLLYDASWYADGCQVQITDNGEIIETGVSGVKHWNAADCLCHCLTMSVVNSAGAEIARESVYFTRASQDGAAVIPDGWSEIPEGMFKNCDWVRSVTIPTSVTSIGKDAFTGCRHIASAILPACVTSVAAVFPESYTTIENIVIRDGVTSIASGMFADCGSLTSVTMPEGVTSIGDDAFYHCSGLTSVTIPSSVTSIGNEAFVGCTNLVSVKLPENLMQLGDYAFTGTPYQDRLNAKLVLLAEFGGASQQNTSVALTTTNVVVHYVLNGIVPEAATPTFDTALVAIYTEVKGDVVAIPQSWAEQFPQFEEKFGSDFAKALTMETGKKGAGGAPMLVWQDFVAGTDPTNPEDVFTASITFDKETGKPIISWSPEVKDASGRYLRKYTVYGKAKLMDEQWEVVPEGREGDYNFYKVTVEML